MPNRGSCRASFQRVISRLSFRILESHAAASVKLSFELQYEVFAEPRGAKGGRRTEGTVARGAGEEGRTPEDTGPPELHGYRSHYQDREQEERRLGETDIGRERERRPEPGNVWDSGC